MSIAEIGISKSQLKRIGIKNQQINYQFSSKKLIQQTLKNKQGELNDTGALCINTGEFTGRSPQDKFTVKDSITKNSVFWNNFNIPINEKYFSRLKDKLTRHLNHQNKIWIRDCYACADDNYRINIRVINENAWSNLFASNMFIAPHEDELENFKPDWHIIHAPSFKADAKTDGTRQHNFAVISFTEKIILIGGTAYTGEMKKGIFTILNYILPHNKNVLGMHCSANIGEDGDVAIFFGLSGTGKTTLSTDPLRKLIGDDEHGWSDNGVFNFEGGCYAKCINLDESKEPEIFHAIKPGALVENITFFPGTNKIDFSSKEITENTRVSYPLDFIYNAVEPGVGNHPKNIFFLTCDAYGVLPPISKLTAAQAMYQFLSGYTAKIAGTETGVTEPKTTFSTCFGAPFLPLHPAKYADMLGQKIKEHNVNVWMINTGWIGGAYGVGNRIELKYTRAMIQAVLNDKLDKVNFEMHPVFKILMPVKCDGVPSDLLNPKNTWEDKIAYDEQAKKLACLYINNFKQYADKVSEDVLEAAPVVG